MLTIIYSDPISDGRLVEMWKSGETPNASLLAVHRATSGALGLSSMSISPAKANSRFYPPPQKEP